MSSPTVRRARLEDVPHIVDICVRGWWATYRELVPEAYIEGVIREYYTVERITREVEDPKGWFGWLVAERDGEVIAAGGGGMTGTDKGEIFVLYADPDHWRSGAGRALVEEMTAQMREAGAVEQWVETTRGNAIGLGFYHRLGFVERGERPTIAPHLPESAGVMSVRLSRPIG